MTVMTGTYGLLEMLRAENVKYIFGNPGTSEAAIMDGLEDFPDIEYILVVQEGVAVGMADAYARATGKVGFISLHIDNGLANAFSLLADSNYAGTPLVITAGNKDVRKLAEGRSDLARMAEPFCKWSVEITHPDQYPNVLRRAFLEARTPPTGPVFVSFSANSLDDEADMDIYPSSTNIYLPDPHASSVKRATELLQSSKHPIMLVGDRVGENDAIEETVQLAEQIGARVYGHVSTQVNFPTNHPQYLGKLPWASIRTENTREKLEKSDVILAIGCPVFSDYFYVPEKVLHNQSSLIHIDTNLGEIGKTEQTTLGIHASPKKTLSLISRELSENITGSGIETAKVRKLEIEAESLNLREKFIEIANEESPTAPIGVGAMAKAISENIPANSVVFDDSVSSGGMLHSAVKFSRPKSYFGSRGGAIGWGMGSGLGLKLANPDRPVFAIVGDGSAMMTIQALWTSVNSKIPVIFIICNNASYRVLKVNMNIYKEDVLGQKDYSSKYLNMDFPIPFDFKAIADAFGAKGYRIEDIKQLGPTIKEAIDLNETIVIDVIIDGKV